MPSALLPIAHGSCRAVANANLVQVAELSALAVPRRSSRLPTSNSPSRELGTTLSRTTWIMADRRCALLTQPSSVDGQFWKVAPEIPGHWTRTDRFRHLRLAPQSLATDALIDPLPQAWIHVQIEQTIRGL